MEASIVIPTLNEEKQLPILLESLLGCKDLNLEVVVVDGKSEDRTEEVVKNYAKRAPGNIEIKFITSEKRNVSYQRNLGAKYSGREIIVFMDADVVISSPEDFQKILELFRENSCSAASVRFRPIEKDWRARIYYFILYCFHKIMEKISPYAVGSFIVTKRKTIQKCGGFDPSIKINEDANFVSRAARCGKFMIFNVKIGVSSRRFRKSGYLRMGLKYLWIFFRRTLWGEIRDDKIEYEFGKYE